MKTNNDFRVRKGRRLRESDKALHYQAISAAIEAMMQRGGMAKPSVVTDALDRLGDLLEVEARLRLTARVNDWLREHGHGYEISLIDHDDNPLTTTGSQIDPSAAWPVLEHVLNAGLADEPRILSGALDSLVQVSPTIIEQANAWLADRHYVYSLARDAAGFVFAKTTDGHDPQGVRQVRWPIVGRVIEELWLTELAGTKLVRFHLEQPVGSVVPVEVHGEDFAQEVAGQFAPGDRVSVTGHFVGEVLRANVVLPAPTAN